MREPLKRLQKYMDQYNIDSEAERTFDQPADDQRFQFKSVHDVEPERAQGQADYIFRQSAQDGAAAACTGTVQDQAAYGAQKPVAERKPREIGKSADQTVDDIGEKAYGESHHRAADHAGRDKYQESKTDLHHFSNWKIEKG